MLHVPIEAVDRVSFRPIINDIRYYISDPHQLLILEKVIRLVHKLFVLPVQVVITNHLDRLDVGLDLKLVVSVHGLDSRGD